MLCACWQALVPAGFAAKFDQMWSMEPAKGKGKGKCKGKGEGNEKGKGKGKDTRGTPAIQGSEPPAAIMDATIDEQVDLALGKTRQMLGMLAKMETNLSEVRVLFGKSTMKNKPMLSSLKDLSNDCSKHIADLKAVLVDGRASAKKVADIKSLLVASAQTLKNSQEQTKKTKLFMTDTSGKSCGSKGTKKDK